MKETLLPILLNYALNQNSQSTVPDTSIATQQKFDPNATFKDPYKVTGTGDQTSQPTAEKTKTTVARTGANDENSYQQFATSAATKYGIDPQIFARQISQESGWNPEAKSPAGAIGIAQFMPDTAKGMGIDPTDPYASLDAAARLMADYIHRYGSYALGAIAYNAGEGGLQTYLQTGYLPDETRQYLVDLGLA